MTATTNDLGKALAHRTIARLNEYDFRALTLEERRFAALDSIDYEVATSCGGRLVNGYRTALIRNAARRAVNEHYDTVQGLLSLFEGGTVESLSSQLSDQQRANIAASA